MVDLRERVEGDRGLLKKIQTHIPGFAGYRRKEDIRAADNMLRIQLADRLGTTRKKLEEGRAALVENYSTQGLDKLGALIMRFKAVEGDIRHAEQGYSGISPSIRIEERQLDLLYEYDFSLITFVVNMEQSLQGFKALARSGDGNKVQDELDRVGGWLDELQSTFKKRMKAISGTEVA